MTRIITDNYEVVKQNYNHDPSDVQKLKLIVDVEDNEDTANLDQITFLNDDEKVNSSFEFINNKELRIKKKPSLLIDMITNKEKPKKCRPGYTVITIEKKDIPNIYDEESHETRRGHMNWVAGSTSNCRICVCSVDGHNEYCWKRPVKNINECIRMQRIRDSYLKYQPFDHTRSLAHRIRRGS